MKYFAILDTDFLQYFRIDMPQKCDPKHFSEKVLVVKDEGGCTRGLYIKPLIKPTLINHENGKSVYLSQKHINILLKFEEMETIQEELAKLDLKENGSCTWLANGCQEVKEKLLRVWEPWRYNDE